MKICAFHKGDTVYIKDVGLLDMIEKVLMIMVNDVPTIVGYELTYTGLVVNEHHISLFAENTGIREALMRWDKEVKKATEGSH